MKRKKPYLAATMDFLDDVREELAKWSGSAATIWSYSVTHSVLAIRLHRQGRKGNLHVQCLGVLSLAGPVGVPGASLILEEITAPLKGGLVQIPALQLRDTGDLGISVLFQDTVVGANVPPVLMV